MQKLFTLLTAAVLGMSTIGLIGCASSGQDENYKMLEEDRPMFDTRPDRTQPGASIAPSSQTLVLTAPDHAPTQGHIHNSQPVDNQSDDVTTTKVRQAMLVPGVEPSVTGLDRSNWPTVIVTPAPVKGVDKGAPEVAPVSKASSDASKSAHAKADSCCEAKDKSESCCAVKTDTASCCVAKAETASCCATLPAAKALAFQAPACCQPGAECCKPGAACCEAKKPCCEGHGHAKAVVTEQPAQTTTQQPVTQQPALEQSAEQPASEQPAAEQPAPEQTK